MSRRILGLGHAEQEYLNAVLAIYDLENGRPHIRNDSDEELERARKPLGS
jgi:hypothetical protein